MRNCCDGIKGCNIGEAMTACEVLVRVFVQCRSIYSSMFLIRKGYTPRSTFKNTSINETVFSIPDFALFLTEVV